MFVMTIKELAARKLRLLTTTFAVFLGVAFMAGTLVFTDTVRATFHSALADANEGVDVYVRTPSEIHLGYGEPGPRLDASLSERIAAVDGVDQVALRINGYAQLVGPDGTPVGDVSRSPAFGANWVTVPELNPYVLFDGRAPTSDDEIVIDKTSAEKAGYEPGDTATVLSMREPRQFTISGIARFGTADSPAGATAVLFTDRTAAELLATPGEADAIAATIDDGASQSAVMSAVQAVVGSDVETITGAALVAEDQAAMDENLGEFRTIMLIFAGVAVFVGAFIINNTFSIIVAQRTKEMAMLRAIGASGRQVKRSVLLEAVVVGTVASALGLAGGIGFATGLKAMMSAFGFDMPEGPTIIQASALVTSFLMGLVVTVVSAWLPARRAARISPMAALRDANVDRSATSGRRAALGAALTLGGASTVWASIDGDVALLGVGALTTFAGISVLGPVLARPVAALFSLPLRMRGISGELATRNASRSPKRTARTAASLMIGVALVGFMAVFAASFKSSIAGSLDEDFTGTHIVQSGSFDNSAGLSPEFAERLRSTPDVDVVSPARVTPAIVGGVENDIFPAFDGHTVGDVFDLGTVQGDLGSLGSDGIAVSAEEAAEHGWVLGSTIDATFPSGTATFIVKAVYDGSSDWMGPMFIDLQGLAANGGELLDHRLYVAGDEAAIMRVAADYSTAEVLDKQGFLDSVSSEIDTMLGMFYVMLMLAIVIALLGIANTLALSIFERTRELGLMRAVGMARGQVRSMVRWESIVIAVFGTTVGLGLGTFFGWATVRAMADQGLDTLTVPGSSLVLVTIIASLAGATAAVLPARRAAKLDVLTALAN